MSQIIYGAYGSNSDPARLQEYISGSPDGGHGAHRGSSDRSEIEPQGLQMISAELYFAGRSKRWGAAVAFLGFEDPDNHRAYVQTYSVSSTQLRDIARQEAGAPASHPVRLPELGESVTFIPEANYGRIVHTAQGIFVITTSEHLEPGLPSRPYVERVVAGLNAAGLKSSEVAKYLMAAGRRLSVSDLQAYRRLVQGVTNG